MVIAQISEGRISREHFVTRLGSVPAAGSDVRPVYGGMPETIGFGLTQSWFGDCLIATSEYGVCWLDLCPDGNAVSKLYAEFPMAEIRQADKQVRRMGKRIFGNTGETAAVHLSGTDFQLRVWQALFRIPAGACMSYAQLAHCIGAPKAARAVGRAIGGNKIAVLVPCHRVVPTSGKIGGFRWGPELKEALLLREHTGVQERFLGVG